MGTVGNWLVGRLEPDENNEVRVQQEQQEQEEEEQEKKEEKQEEVEVEEEEFVHSCSFRRWRRFDLQISS